VSIAQNARLNAQPPFNGSQRWNGFAFARITVDVAIGVKSGFPNIGTEIYRALPYRFDVVSLTAMVGSRLVMSLEAGEMM